MRPNEWKLSKARACLCQGARLESPKNKNLIASRESATGPAVPLKVTSSEHKRIESDGGTTS